MNGVNFFDSVTDYDFSSLKVYINDELTDIPANALTAAAGDEIKSRMQCQKHKLEAFLEAYDPELSEYENMALNDWDRVYDCSNIKVEYTFS